MFTSSQLKYIRVATLFIRFITLILTTTCAYVGQVNIKAGASPNKPGVVFQDCDVCPKMTVIQSGSYTMGSDGRHKYERPSQKVTIAKSFAMGVYEVTFNEWEACFLDGGCNRVPYDHNWGKGRRPIMNITWFETQSYLKWLSKKTGHTYRLPSEAEWEFAARGGTTTEFWWGDEVGENLANCRDCKSPWSKKGSAPVGSFAANPYGLYDVHGNEWEWLQDCWNPSHEGAPNDGSARLSGNCQLRVIRSGSWYYFSKNMRSSWRFKNDARVKSYGIGMRVLRELP